MKTSKKTILIGLLIALLPLIAYAALYSKLPEEVPLQFGLDDTVNRYGSKLELLLVPVITLATYLLLIVLPKIDPRKDNYKKFQNFYNFFVIGITLFLDIVFFIILIEIFYPNKVPVSKIVFLLTGILFILLGNYMPTIKPNFFMGIKTPWTLSSDTVWIKTHRIGGYSFIFLGIIMLLSIFFNTTFVYIGTFLMIGCATIPIIMSYVYYKREQSENNEK